MNGRHHLADRPESPELPVVYLDYYYGWTRQLPTSNPYASVLEPITPRAGVR